MTTRIRSRTRRRHDDAFATMLDMRRALVTGMLTYGEGRYTILESSEDDATDILAAAFKRAMRRAVDRERRRLSR